MPLPFTESISSAKLRGSDSITFDPLGVAAVLGNPRADLSAARLYIQSDRSVFRWPHTTMIGGALTPVSTLVSHLASYDSIHPAVSMCTKDEMTVDVISDTIFRQLRVNVSNLWLRDALSFRPSKVPLQIHGERQEFGRAANDIEIVLVKHVFDQGSVSRSIRHSFSVLWRRAIINLAGILTGLLLSVGLVFSVLDGEIWGLALFFLYLSHWFASSLISFTYLVKTTCPDVRQDDEIKFAIHERPPDIGGMVIFKGTQHEIETWYRTTLQFRRELFADILHWFWIITGALSAVSSVACMVNMKGDFQLGFLAVLFYSSLAELWVTQCARSIQREIRQAGGLGKAVVLTENKSRTAAITRATLGVEDECSTRGLDWVGLKLLPQMQPIFQQYQKLLNALTAEPPVTLEVAINDFRQNCKIDQIGPKDKRLAERIIDEVREIVETKAQRTIVASPPLKQQHNFT